MQESPIDLQPEYLQTVFNAVGESLEGRRDELNRLDEFNHDHGDHMVEVFHLAAQAAGDGELNALAESMKRASALLSARVENGSAQVYARGLSLLGEQFRQRQIELDDLLLVVQQYMSDQKGEEQDESGRSSEVSKALLNALAEWEKLEDSQADGAAGKAGGLDMGYLFGVGMAYLQAKQKGGDRLDVLSETVVSASPLGKLPHRHASGVIAVRALLEALKG